MAKQVSDLIVERLMEWGVDTIFGFPGDGVDGFFESLRTHRTSCASFRCGTRKLPRSPPWAMRNLPAGSASAAQPPGPGGIHLLNGLYDAKCDQHPVLAITGHTFHDLIGMDYQQDVDLDKLYHGCLGIQSSASWVPAHAVNVVDMAVRSAYGRTRRRPHLHSERHPGVAGHGQDAQQRNVRDIAAIGRAFHCETGGVTASQGRFDHQ